MKAWEFQQIQKLKLHNTENPQQFISWPNGGVRVEMNFFHVQNVQEVVCVCVCDSESCRALYIVPVGGVKGCTRNKCVILMATF